MYDLRPAGIQDSALLSEFAERSFRETFDQDNTQENMSMYVSKTFGEEKQREELLDSNRRIFLAMSGHDGIGYYHLLIGKSDASVLGPSPIELVRLYVDSRWHGRSVAHSLLQNAIDSSCQEDFLTMWLGVWEKNHRAQTFYKKWGFVEVGFHTFELGNDPQRDLILSRPLMS